MDNEAELFTAWVFMQNPGGIMPTQIGSTGKILSRIKSGDLVRVLYFGDDAIAMNALKILKERFLEELEEFEKQKMEEMYENSWH